MHINFKHFKVIIINLLRLCFFLFNFQIDFSGLDALELHELNIESLWPDFDHKPLTTTSYMENLTSLQVENCNKLKYLFSFAVAERLVKLRSLKVIDCSEMEDVVAAREEYPPTSEQILFPKLESIELSNLGGLKSFCGGADHCIQLPNLSNLWINECPKLKTFVDKQGENELDATKPFFDENVSLTYLFNFHLVIYIYIYIYISVRFYYPQFVIYQFKLFILLGWWQ